MFNVVIPVKPVESVAQNVEEKEKMVESVAQNVEEKEKMVESVTQNVEEKVEEKEKPVNKNEDSPQPSLSDIHTQILKLRHQDHHNLKTLFTITEGIFRDMKSIKTSMRLLSCDQKHNMNFSELLDLIGNSRDKDSQEIIIAWFATLVGDRLANMEQLLELIKIAVGRVSSDTIIHQGDDLLQMANMGSNVDKYFA
jgi:hypothetical protein